MYSKIEYYFDIIFEEKNYSKIVFGVVSGKAGRVQGAVIDETPKSPIEKGKRNLKLFSPIWRRERELCNSFLQFREGKEKFAKKVVHFR